MKKIAYVITQSEMGGAQKSILLLCRCLKKEYDITVYSAPGGQFIDELKLLEINHIPVENMVREINLLKDFMAYKFLLKEFISKSYDIVHCHSSKAGIIAREAANMAKVKNIIYTAHGFVFNEPMNKYKKDLYIFLEKYEAKKSNTIICVDPNDIAIAKKLGIYCKNNITYVPNGIDFDNSHDENVFHIENNKFTFGFVANFYENKGHRYLIEAFNRLIETENCNVELILVGGGELEEDMKLLAKDNPYIKFLGFRKDAEKVMKSFDCFIMSSVKEGFPFVILEAIKNNIPVISTEVGAIRELLQNGKLGYITKPFDSQGLMHSMLYVINNQKEAHDKARKAYKYCLENYSIKKMINSTKEIYEAH